MVKQIFQVDISQQSIIQENKNTDGNLKTYF